jgi:hypothetical protein
MEIKYNLFPQHCIQAKCQTNVVLPWIFRRLNFQFKEIYKSDLRQAKYKPEQNITNRQKVC